LSPEEKLTLLKAELEELLNLGIPDYPDCNVDPNSFPAAKALLNQINKKAKIYER
jgi:hypothetical protein